MNELDIEV